MKKIRYNFKNKTMLTTLVMLIVFSGALFAQGPVVDGLFYGTPALGGLSDFAADRYDLTANSVDADGNVLASLYTKTHGDYMYVAVVSFLNDNVFDYKDGGSNLAYIETAGWGGIHTADKLIVSDHLEMHFECGTQISLDWFQDYVDDLNEDRDPSALDWFSSPYGDDGEHAQLDTWSTANGDRDFVKESASSFEWNIENTVWDVTEGLPNPVSADWKSPDGFTDLDGILPDNSRAADESVIDDGYNDHWDSYNLWEWTMVYEMKLDISDCLEGDPVIISPWNAHNSPAKPGEPEDLYFLEWGDLPWGVQAEDGKDRKYGTELIDDGPRHYIIPEGPYLGKFADVDTDGVPTYYADGDDDFDVSDDEDGVTLIKVNIYTGFAEFEVIAGTDGVLNAWLDWDGDGTFEDAIIPTIPPATGANEWIIKEEVIAAGTHTIYIPIAIGFDNVLYHRWRLTSAAGMANSPTGLADDGEVEDYRDTDFSLAVELTSFTAEAVDEGIICKWTTESETENLGFILERKTQGTNWMEIASYKTDEGLLGQGSTPSYTDYSYLDMFAEPNVTYEYRLADVDYSGLVTYHATRKVTAGQAPQASVLEKFKISPAYPNPFNPSTTITYFLPNNNNNLVQVKVYDITGNLVRTLLNANQQAGNYSIVWDGKDNNGEIVPAGTYFNRISYGTESKTIKMMMLK